MNEKIIPKKERAQVRKKKVIGPDQAGR